jgi:cysteine-rich repeat protein
VSDDGCDANCQVTGCGNGLIVGAETCDDGNMDDQDACPSDCIIDACEQQVGTDFTVTVNFAGSNDVAGITVFLDYPEGQVNIPGSGAGVPTGIITDLPGFAFGQTNDLDHALIQAVVDAEAFPAGQLFNIHFQTCAGAPAPTAGQFTCTVQTAGDVNLVPIPGVTCSVALP